GNPHQGGQVYGLPGGLPICGTLARFKPMACGENFGVVNNYIIEVGCARSSEFLAKSIPVVHYFYTWCFGRYRQRDRLVIITGGGNGNPVGIAGARSIILRAIEQPLAITLSQSRRISAVLILAFCNCITNNNAATQPS